MWQVAEGAAVTRGRKQIVLMLGTVVSFFFACLLPFKERSTSSFSYNYVSQRRAID
jgi:hypothetical protein